MAKSLLELLEEDKIELKPSGERWVTTCPFHEGDNTPSLTIYPGDRGYYCFSCRAWGDEVKWLVDYRGMPVAQALDYLGVDYKVKRSSGVIKIRNIGKVYPFLTEVANIYHKALLKQPGALQYLRSRGLTDETITHYRLGYTDGKVLGLNWAEDYKMAQEVGLINETGYELLSHRITIPNIVKNTLCDFMIGRTVVNDKVKYLGIRVPKPLIGLWDVRFEPVWFVVEGNFDYLLLRQWGFPAVATGGTNITKVNMSMLKSKKLILVPDNDTAGESSAKSMLATHPDAVMLDYTSLKAKDVGEVALLENGEERFKDLIRRQFPWLTNSLPSLQTFPKLFEGSTATISLPLT